MNVLKVKTKYIISAIVAILILIFGLSNIVYGKTLTFEEFAHNHRYACIQHGGTLRTATSADYPTYVYFTGKYRPWISTTYNSDGTVKEEGHYASYKTNIFSNKKVNYIKEEGKGIPFINYYSAGKSGRVDSTHLSEDWQRAVAFVLYKNGGWKSSSQYWIWSHVSDVINALGSSTVGPSNEPLVLQNVPIYSAHNPLIASTSATVAVSDSSNETSTEPTVNDGFDVGDYDQAEIDNESDKYNNGELKQYMKETELPKLENKGDNPVKTDNAEWVGPFTINYDDTNKNQDYEVVFSGNKPYAVSKLKVLTLEYLDGETVSVPGITIRQNGETFTDLNKLEKNVPFEIQNVNIEKEIVNVHIELEKWMITFFVNGQVWNGTTAKVDESVLKSLIEETKREFEAQYSNRKDFEVKATKTVTTQYIPQNPIEITNLGVRVEKVTVTLDIPVKVNKGGIGLEKKGLYDDKEENLAGIAFKIYCDSVGKYVKDIKPNANASNGTEIEFTENFEEAKDWVTGKDGKLLIDGLFAGEAYTYKLIEVDGGDNFYYKDPLKISEASGYTLGHLEVNGKKYCTIEGIKVKDSAKDLVEIVVKDDRTSGDLSIEKVDETYPETIKLKDAQFKIKLVQSDNTDENHNLNLSNLWLKLPKNASNGNYDFSELLHDEYLGDVDSAGTFTTDENGIINIKCIINGTYRIYETKTSIGYDITKQEGYGKDPEHPEWVYYGEITITTGKNHIEQRLANRKIVAKIEGHVWEDGPDTNKSGTTYDSLRFTYSDGVIDPGITVNLKDEKGNLMASTITDGSGYWAIAKKSDNADIYYWDLTNAYVEFVYDNIKYVCVDAFEGGKSKVDANSKAQEYSLTEEELDDTNLTGVTGNLPGLAVTKQGATSGMSELEILEKKLSNDKYSIEELGLTGYYNDDNYTVENINLGLWRKIEPTYDILQSLQYSKILMNGYTYTYDYNDGNSGYADSSMIPVTYKQTGAKYYGAKVYPSDIAYTAEGKANGMEMYVVYKITIHNNTTTHMPDIYDELRLYLTSLTDTFDASRYELSTLHGKDKNWAGSEYFELWEATQNNTANYKIAEDGNVDGDHISDGIKPGSTETESVYIQFKVQQKFLEQVLAGTITDEQMNGAVTVSHSIGHHAYSRTDNVWSKAESAKYYANSREQDKVLVNDAFLHRSVDLKKDSGELCLLFVLGEERTISGTVFEDTVTKESDRNKENLGNGILDNEEQNRALGVKVELIDASTGTNADLYQHTGDVPKGYKVVSGENTVEYTAKDGYYEFKGIVPGLYNIKLTYSDGTQKMVDADGNEIEEITSNDYKSTIINTKEDEAGNYIKDAMEESKTNMESYINIYKDQNNDNTLRTSAQKIVEWYKYLYDKNPYKQFNIATDDFKTRSSFAEYEYSNEDGKIVVKDKEGNIVEKFPEISSNTPYFSISIENDIEDYSYVSEIDGYAHSPKYERFDLGLIKTPETNIILDKVISDVKLTNSAGTILVQGDPREALSYVTALDNLPTGSKYARVEMELNSIYGTEIETTYKITINNESIKDYIEDSSNDHFGYYFKYGDKGNAYLKLTTVTEVIDMIDEDYDVKDSKVEEVVEHPEESRNGKELKTSDVTMSVKDTTDGTKYLSFGDWEGIESGGLTQIQYKANGLFQEDMDLIYENSAKITKMKLDLGSSLETKYQWGDYSKTTLMVSPDTGEDRRPTYFVVGTMALIVIATGIVVIKKKILK